MSEWRRTVSLGRRDKVEPGVVKAFEAAGATVQRLSGKDCPDLAVGLCGRNFFVEVKTDRARLRPGQKDWRDTWAGEKPVLVRTPAQARKWVKTWTARATSLSSLLRAQRAAADAVTLCTHGAVEGTACEACVAGAIGGGGRDQAWEDHEDRVAERERTEGAA